MLQSASISALKKSRGDLIGFRISLRLLKVLEQEDRVFPRLGVPDGAVLKDLDRTGQVALRTDSQEPSEYRNDFRSTLAS